MITQVKLTSLAIRDAKRLTLPLPPTQLTLPEHNQEWIRAFTWYNYHFSKQKQPLGLKCRPCYTQVFTNLKRAQEQKVKKVVYIAHPISGDIEENLAAIRIIVRNLNRDWPDLVPFVPYYVDIVSLDDTIPEDRAKGISNDLEIFERGLIDEVWLFGNKLSSGMKGEVLKARELGIPVAPQTSATQQELMQMENKDQEQIKQVQF